MVCIDNHVSRRCRQLITFLLFVLQNDDCATQLDGRIGEASRRCGCLLEENGCRNSGRIGRKYREHLDGGFDRG